MKRSNLTWGIILILLGAAFLVNQFFPNLFFSGIGWPWILLLIGGIFTVGGFIGRNGGMLIPGFVLLTLGGIFTYQVRTNDWESWAYIWALLPAAAGLGMWVGGLFDSELRKARPVATIMVLGGLIVAAVMAGFFGLDADVLRFWPVLLILLGLWVLFKALRVQQK